MVRGVQLPGRTSPLRHPRTRGLRSPAGAAELLARAPSARPPDRSARVPAAWLAQPRRQRSPTRQVVHVAEGSGTNHRAILRSGGVPIRGAHLRVGATSEEAHAAQHGAGDLRGLHRARRFLQLRRARHLLEPAVDQLASHAPPSGRAPGGQVATTIYHVPKAWPRTQAKRISTLICVPQRADRAHAGLHRRDPLTRSLRNQQE